MKVNKTISIIKSNEDSKKRKREQEIYEENAFKVSKLDNKIAISDKVGGKYEHSKYRREGDYIIVTFDYSDHITFTHSICNKNMRIKIKNSPNHDITTQHISVKCYNCKTGWRDWRKNHSQK